MPWKRWSAYRKRQKETLFPPYQFAEARFWTTGENRKETGKWNIAALQQSKQFLKLPIQWQKRKSAQKIRMRMKSPSPQALLAGLAQAARLIVFSLVCKADFNQRGLPSKASATARWASMRRQEWLARLETAEISPTTQSNELKNGIPELLRLLHV